jgi:cell division septal protein FtsQ
MAGKNDKSASVRDNQSSSQRRLIIIAVMAAVGLTLGIVLISILKHKLYTDNPKFIVDKLDKIEISGLNKLERPKLIEDAEIKKLVVGKNLFDIPLKTLRTNIKKNPLVEDAEIRRVLPSGLTIKVTERVPVVRLAKADPKTALLVDSKGIVMPPVSHNDFKGLPVFGGHICIIRAVAGTPLDARLLPVLDLLNYISTNTTLSLTLDIKTLYFEENNYIPTVKLVLRKRFPFTEGATVRLPVTENDYKLKLKQLMTIVQDRRDRGLDITSVDASLQNNIPVEPRPGFVPFFSLPSQTAETPDATRPSAIPAPTTPPVLTPRRPSTTPRPLSPSGR